MMNYGVENWIILNLLLRYMYNEDNIKKKKENCLGDPLLLSKKNLKKLNKLKKLTKMR